MCTVHRERYDRKSQSPIVKPDVHHRNLARGTRQRGEGKRGRQRKNGRKDGTKRTRDIQFLETFIIQLLGSINPVVIKYLAVCTVRSRHRVGRQCFSHDRKLIAACNFRSLLLWNSIWLSLPPKPCHVPDRCPVSPLAFKFHRAQQLKATTWY